jgi:hypothetical protein
MALQDGPAFWIVLAAAATFTSLHTEVPRSLCQVADSPSNLPNTADGTCLVKLLGTSVCGKAVPGWDTTAFIGLAAHLSASTVPAQWPHRWTRWLYGSTLRSGCSTCVAWRGNPAVFIVLVGVLLRHAMINFPDSRYHFGSWDIACALESTTVPP